MAQQVENAERQMPNECPTCGSNARWAVNLGTFMIGESAGPFYPCADPWHELTHAQPMPSGNPEENGG